MHKASDTLSLRNIDKTLATYVASAEQLGESIASLRGLTLLAALKRDKVRVGPYPDVTLFEAANRIMTDLVILYGVRWLLKRAAFPFDTYLVEYGNQNKNGFDLRANERDACLIGEAFNVASSFFQLKKGDMLKKLRTFPANADFTILMFNSDAVSPNYDPHPRGKEFFVIVDISTGDARMVPERVPNTTGGRARFARSPSTGQRKRKAGHPRRAHGKARRESLQPS